MISSEAKFFLNTGDVPTAPWHRWIGEFECRLLAKNITANDAKYNQLKYYCGSEARRRIKSLVLELPADAPSYEALKKGLEQTFLEVKGNISAYIQFTERRQRPGETTDAFIADLRELASWVSFDELEDVDLVTCVLARGTNVPQVADELHRRQKKAELATTQ